MKKITRREAFKKGGQVAIGVAAGPMLINTLTGCQREKAEEHVQKGTYVRSPRIVCRRYLPIPWAWII